MRFPGDLCDEATPVPIPNTVVKFVSSDNTAGATQWEDSPLPGNLRTCPRKLVCAGCVISVARRCYGIPASSIFTVFFMEATKAINLHDFYRRMVDSAGSFTELYDAMEGWAEVVLEENPILECQTGCARCCMHQVLVSDSEWELIHLWMRDNLDKTKRQEIIGRIESQLEEPGNPLSRWLGMRNKHPKAFVRSVNQGFQLESTRCAMLGPGNRCEIYPVRPFVCRAYGRARMGGGNAMICEVFAGRFRQEDRNSDDLNLEEMTVLSPKYFELAQSKDGNSGLYTLMAAHVLRNRTATGDFVKQPQSLVAEKTFPVVTKDDFPIGS